MITDVDLDRVLTALLADGGERAPQADVEAALGRGRDDPAASAPAVAASDGRREPDAAPDAGRRRRSLVLPSVVGDRPRRGAHPAPRIHPIAAARRLRCRRLVRVDLVRSSTTGRSRSPIPERWSAVEDRCSEYRALLRDDRRRASLSVAQRVPVRHAVCSPTCQTVRGADHDPVLDAEAQLEAPQGRASVSDRGQRCLDRPAAGRPAAGRRRARLDTTGRRPDGREWRRVHVVGIRDANVSRSPGASRPMSSTRPCSTRCSRASPPRRAGLQRRRPGARRRRAFTMPIPGHVARRRPTDPRRRAAQRRAHASRTAGSSSASASGRHDRLVRPGLPSGCTGVTSLDVLEAAIRDGAGARSGRRRPTLGGEPAARPWAVDAPVERVRRSRCTTTARSRSCSTRATGTSRLVSSTTMLDELRVRRSRRRNRVDQVFTTADGQVGAWRSRTRGRRSRRTTASSHGASRRMTVRVGDDDGTIMTCEHPAGPWELCREVKATTLEDLADAVQPARIDDHGVGPPSRPPTTRRPSAVSRASSSGSRPTNIPAHGGQEVVYIVAMHDGRPFIVRIRHADNDSSGGPSSPVPGRRLSSRRLTPLRSTTDPGV